MHVKNTPSLEMGVKDHDALLMRIRDLKVGNNADRCAHLLELTVKDLISRAFTLGQENPIQTNEE